MIKSILGGLFGVFLSVCLQSFVLWLMPWGWNMGEWTELGRIGSFILWLVGFAEGFIITWCYLDYQKHNKKQEKK